MGDPDRGGGVCEGVEAVPGPVRVPNPSSPSSSFPPGVEGPGRLGIWGVRGVECDGCAWEDFGRDVSGIDNVMLFCETTGRPRAEVYVIYVVA